MSADFWIGFVCGFIVMLWIAAFLLGNVRGKIDRALREKNVSRYTIRPLPPTTVPRVPPPPPLPPEETADGYVIHIGQVTAIQYDELKERLEELAKGNRL